MDGDILIQQHYSAVLQVKVILKYSYLLSCEVLGEKIYTTPAAV